MRARHAVRPRHQHGEHRYDAASFGVSDDMLRARFSEYQRSLRPGSRGRLQATSAGAPSERTGS
jgi:hypothetical protein